MKMRNRWFVLGLLASAAVFLFSGCVTADQSTPEPETETAEETRNETPVPTRPVITESGVRTFGYYMSTETAELDGVPAIETADGFYSGVVNCNYDCNMISVDYTTKEEYDAYLKLLQSEGFTLYADNGETGIHEDVYNAVLTRDELTLYVIYQALQNKTYIIAGTKENLSPHLIDHNAPNAAHLRATYEPFFRHIRNARPDLPVIMISAADAHWGDTTAERRAVIHTAFRNALERGDQKVWFIDGQQVFEEFGGASVCTVDMTHPNDLGFWAYAKILEPVLREALGK